MNKTNTLFLAVASSLLLSACGGSSDSGSDAGGGDNTGGGGATVETGVFVDSAVGNISYTTETQSGTTNDAGEFSYVAGESVTFSIGELEFPATEAAELVTPVDVLNASATDDDALVNMVRLLLSLDADQDPDNGISIPTAAADVATANIDIFVSTEEFANNTDVQDLVQNGGQDVAVDALVSTDVAVSHLEATLAENNITVASIVGAWHETDRPDSFESVTDVFILFRGDGAYYQFEIENADEGTGFEYGNYSYSLSTLDSETIIDTNGPTGLNSATGVNIEVDTDTMEIIVEDEPTVGFSRINSDGIVGGWSIQGSDDVVIIFNSDGVYAAAQGVEADDITSMEYGTYTYNEAESSLSLDFAIDSAPDVLLSSITFGTVTIENGIMTVEIVGEAEPAVFTKI